MKHRALTKTQKETLRYLLQEARANKALKRIAKIVLKENERRN